MSTAQVFKKFGSSASILAVMLLGVGFKAFGADRSSPVQSVSSTLEASAGCVECLGKQRSFAQEEILRISRELSEAAKDPQGWPRKDPRRRASEDEKRIFSPVVSIAPKQALINPNTGEIVDDAPERAWANAFMISPCHALTNYHAVFGGSTEPDPKKFSVTVNIGYNPKTDRPYRITAVPVAFGEKNLRPQDTAEDWAIIKLSSCPGPKQGIGWLEFIQYEDYKKLRKPVKATNVGFFGDREKLYNIEERISEPQLWNKRLTIHNNCLADSGGTYLHHTCASTPGSSGSPIVIFDEEGVPKIVGMAAKENVDGGAFGVSLAGWSGFFTENGRFRIIQAEINEYIRQYGVNPAKEAALEVAKKRQ